MGEIVTTELITDLRELIDSVRHRVASTVNQELALLYWRVGQRIQTEVLGEERAGYGQEIVSTVSRQLTQQYGRGFSRPNVHRMIGFATAFPDEEKVTTLSAQLGWSHFCEILLVKEPLARDYYAEMCRIEGWNVRTLRKK